MKDIVEQAEKFAYLAHGGQSRKYTGEPYTNHLREVAGILFARNAPDFVIAAGWLHDVVEDTDATIDDIRFFFGHQVANIVEAVTDVSKAEDGNRAARKKLDREHVARAGHWGQTVKVADLISNTASIVEHDPKFATVYLEEKAALLDVLDKADRGLLDYARTQVAEAYATLKEREALR